MAWYKLDEKGNIEGLLKPVVQQTKNYTWFNANFTWS